MSAAPRLRFALILCMILTLLPVPGAAQRSGAPRVPPAKDPGGPAIALLTTGIDYTLPEIAAQLARDGEGEPIAWDFVDNDNRPFVDRTSEVPPAWGGDGTALAAALASLIAPPHAAARLIPVRIDPRNSATLAKAAAFVARTPARVMVVPMWTADREEWEPFRQAAAHFPHLLFCTGAGDGSRNIDTNPVFPAALVLDNILVVTAGLFSGDRIQLLGNSGAATVDATVVLSPESNGIEPRVPPSAMAAAVACFIAARISDRSITASGAELKKAVLDGSQFRIVEQPPVSRTGIVLRIPEDGNSSAPAAKP